MNERKKIFYLEAKIWGGKQNSLRKLSPLKNTMTGNSDMLGKKAEHQ